MFIFTVICYFGRLYVQKLTKRGKITVRELRNINAFFVYQAVGEKKDLHSEGFCHHVVAYVVSDHYAAFRIYSVFRKYCFVVVETRLTVTGVFIGCVELKIIG